MRDEGPPDYVVGMFCYDALTDVLWNQTQLSNLINHAHIITNNQNDKNVAR